MTTTDREQAVDTLRDLRDWAGYIFESLTRTPRDGAPPLEAVMDERSLRELRRMAWTLRQRLSIVGVEAECRDLEQTVRSA
jgi:hypothetical protein